MQENELEKEFATEENEERDIFEEAEPDFDEEEEIFEEDSENKKADEKVMNAEETEEEEIGEDADEREMEHKKKTPNKKGGFFSELCSFILYIGAAVLITFFLLHYVGQRTVVNGPSMMNTLHNGDNIILDKVSYYFHAPERFDIIVFPVENEEKNYIKRIIGLPGETVQIVNGFVYITDKDGKSYELEESYGAEIMLDPDTGEYLTTAPVKLEEDEYFVLGDNRNNSIDSRRIGAVSRDIIKGRAWVRVYPFDSMGKLN